MEKTIPPLKPSPTRITATSTATFQRKPPCESESLHHTFPLTFFWPGGSKSVYWYTYKKVNPNGVSNTSKGGVIVTHQWKDGKWVITDVLAPEVPLCQYLFDAFFPY